MYIFLKYLSQILLLIGGIFSYLREFHITTPTGKKRAGLITIAALPVGFILFVVTERKEQQENVRKDAMQQQEISTLRQLNLNLRQLNLNDNLSEVEISFKPSAEHWAKIIEAYRQVNPKNMTVSYSDTGMIAERDDKGYWNINFEPVQRREGYTGFSPVATNEPRNKGFENVIREAAISLWIKFGDSAPIEIQPKRGDYYPSAIKVSQDEIAFILRPPKLKWNLNNVHGNPNIRLRGENYPSNLRVRSTGSDVKVIFDQTFELNWTEKDDNTFEAKMMPYISGPHRLNAKFNFDPT
jgi:hypothetical protein